ncbi:rhsC domain protein [Escherichia coli DEC7A]|nr:rhsC domain protein [Escherichia coli DEC7A]
MTDGAGRHFRLVLTTQAQRAEEARQQAISGGRNRPLFLIPCRVTPNMAGTTASVCLPCG